MGWVFPQRINMPYVSVGCGRAYKTYQISIVLCLRPSNNSYTDLTASCDFPALDGWLLTKKCSIKEKLYSIFEFVAGTCLIAFDFIRQCRACMKLFYSRLGFEIGNLGNHQSRLIEKDKFELLIHISGQI